MSIQFNHTIVHGRDNQESAQFLVDILGLTKKPREFFHFLVVELENGVTLDFLSTDEEFAPQHYAFLVSDDEFDQIFKRIKERKILYWADPRTRLANQINDYDGGRGFYFKDPGENLMEVLTRPYGSSKFGTKK